MSWIPSICELRDRRIPKADLSLCGMDLKGQDLTGMALIRCDLTGVDLRATDLTDAAFEGCILDDADLRGAVLDGTVVRGCSAEGTDLRDVELSNAHVHDLCGTPVLPHGEVAVWGGCASAEDWLRVVRGETEGITLRGRVELPDYASFRGAKLCDLSVVNQDVVRGVDFTGAVLERVRLRGLCMDGCNFTDAVLRDVDLRGADLSGCRFDGTVMEGLRLDAHTALGTLRGVDLSGADLRKAGIHVFEALVGVRLNGADLRGIELTCAMRDCDLSRARLVGASFLDGVLTGVRMRHADLRDAYLGMASWDHLHDLSTCRLEGAILHMDLAGRDLSGIRLRGMRLEPDDSLSWRGTTFDGADLRGVDFGGQRLCGASFRGADLRRARFIGADTTGAVLDDADRRGAVGLCDDRDGSREAEP